jgi:LacI family transcriptional regulator
MKKSTHPTLIEVARKAGVGTTTVSRVINGGERVSPDTLARVLSVIEAVGYTPNQAARALKGHRTKTIGLVLPSIADPFFSSCAEAAQAVARANDSLLIVTTTQNNPHTEIESINVLIRHRTDGLLIAPADSHGRTLRDLLSRIVIPTVSIDRPVYDSLIASVVVDNFKGANVATEHLIEHGYKRILCLTGESTLYTIRERINGYRKAIEAACLPCLIDTSVKDYKSTEDAIKSFLADADPPDAIFTLKNSTTIYAFEALQKLNVPVPGTIALLGFDDFELASTVRPSVSVIEQPVEEMARIAAELLFKRLLDGAKLSPPAKSRKAEQVKLDTRLIRRDSCGCDPGSDLKTKAG